MVSRAVSVELSSDDYADSSPEDQTPPPQRPTATAVPSSHDGILPEGPAPPSPPPSPASRIAKGTAQRPKPRSGGLFPGAAGRGLPVQPPRRSQRGAAPAALGELPPQELLPQPLRATQKPAPLKRAEAARAAAKSGADPDSLIEVAGVHSLIDDPAYRLVPVRQQLQLLHQLVLKKGVELEWAIRQSDDSAAPPPVGSAWGTDKVPPTPFPRNGEGTYLKSLGRIGSSEWGTLLWFK